MEAPDLLSNANKLSNLDICLELPPNQASPGPSNLNLIGKLITSKAIGTSIIKDILFREWKPSLPMDVQRMGRDIFLFTFQHGADLFTAFHRRPWSIRGSHLILKCWNPELAWHEVDFSTLSFWVQVHGLPALWQSEKNFRAIGSKAGRVLDLDVTGEGGGVWRRFSRIQVEVNIFNPFLTGISLPQALLGDLWISLKYETLADACYKCGILVTRKGFAMAIHFGSKIRLVPVSKASANG
nr:hypothetical protein CFP56_26549 [Quercus suber]